MNLIKVAVVGASGRMGREAIQALLASPDFEITAAIVRQLIGEAISPDGVLYETDLAGSLDRVRPDVVLDLSRAPATLSTAVESLSRGVPIVSGVTGIADDVLTQIGELTEKYGTSMMIVPNFAIGAVLMMHFAELAARWIPDAEVLEYHHEKKVDAPSGTAILTAQRIARARINPTTVQKTQVLKAESARGATVDDVPVHSVRLPGLLAHQEVIFGAPGEVLTIRHDAADRSVYMPGVLLCLRSVSELSGLTIGMDKILFGEG